MPESIATGTMAPALRWREQLSLWLALVGAGVLITFTPGACTINTRKYTLTSGFRRSIGGILGQQAALIVHVIVVALGVGVLFVAVALMLALMR